MMQYMTRAGEGTPSKSEGLNPPWPDSRGAAPKALRWSKMTGSVCWERGDEQPSCLAQGVPLRLELGMKDVEKRSVMVARRDTGAKEVVPFADMAARVPALLEQIQVRTCSQRIVCCMDGTSRYCYQ